MKCCSSINVPLCFFVLYHTFGINAMKKAINAIKGCGVYAIIEKKARGRQI